MKLEEVFYRYVDRRQEKPLLPFKKGSEKQFEFDFYLVESTLHKWYVIIDGLTANTIADITHVIQDTHNLTITHWLVPSGRMVENSDSLSGELTELDAGELIYDPQAETEFSHYRGYGIAEVRGPALKGRYL